ncbi:reticulon-like protein B2 isoform X2 [Canna indica]|uniref:Reticulon-like protein n=1 Tax=Canna indica TaxID=4628 RepID=A0AAQ3JPB7_9LILI|nr:reticulon-like protein B2 isoform X2 [Canna indica]
MMMSEIGSHTSDRVNEMIHEYKGSSSSSSDSDSDKPSFHASRKKHLFGRKESLHAFLGGGKLADIILWRNKQLSGSMLAGFTVVWLLFEWIGYHLLTFICHSVIFLLGLCFLWSNAASFVNRAPPKLPEVFLPEDSFLYVAHMIRGEINEAFATFRYVASGKDSRTFLKAIGGLWVVSVVGGWFSFLTLIYIVVLLVYTAPVFYEKFEDHVDLTVEKAMVEINKHYAILDEKSMESSQNNQACSSHGKKACNFKWKSTESTVLLDCLVQQVQSGDRFEKDFKDSQISKVVKTLNEKVGIQVTNNNVYNHLRGWRNKWSQIVKLKEKSEMSWDENKKKIVMGRDEYFSYIKNHPKDAALINKPIDFYDQMSIIFGGSLATCRWSKDDNDSLGAPQSKDNVEFANPGVNVHTNDVSIDAQAHSTQGASSSSEKTKKKPSKGHRKNEDDIMIMVANNIKELTVAIKEYKEPEVSIDGLYKAVMSISGFDESQLCHAYRMLVGSPTREARAFMVASAHHRYLWIRDMLNM